MLSSRFIFIIFFWAGMALGTGVGTIQDTNAAPELADRSPTNSLQMGAEGKSIDVFYSIGTEGRIIHFEKIGDSEWAYVHFITGSYRGRRGWLPANAKEKNVRLYALDKNQAFQTLESKRAEFARVTGRVLGRLSMIYQPKSSQEISRLGGGYTVDFFNLYPRSNFGISTILAHTQYMTTSCPLHPVQRSGKPCEVPPKKYKLPPHLKRAVTRASKRHQVHPAIVAAILQKESFFNPFIENRYEKSICTKQKARGEKCVAYMWGQGLAQLGATNAKDYGIQWMETISRPKICAGRHIFKIKCFNFLERKCKAYYKRNGLYPSYCPKAGISAVAKYVSDLVHSERKIRVDVVNRKGIWSQQVVDITKIMRRNLADEFRYIVGMYNRGMRPINSIEEHYRQFGAPPKWYDNAWITERKIGFTPSVEMGYMILHKELINRCHVWQVAGLCGMSLTGTLSGEYLKDFPAWPTPALRGTATTSIKKK